MAGIGRNEYSELDGAFDAGSSGGSQTAIGIVGSGFGGDEGDERALTVNQLRDEMVRAITEGITATEDIYDEHDVLLLAAGSKITKRFLQLLRQRGVRKVRLRRPGEAPAGSDAIPGISAMPRSGSEEDLEEAAAREDEFHTASSMALDEALDEELAKVINFHPVKAWRRPRLAANELKHRAERAVEAHAETSATVADICGALERGHELSSMQLRQTVTQYVAMTALDFDLLPLIVSMKKTEGEYLYDHCVNVSLMSMAIASQLGLPPEQVSDVGLAGMLQDIGMLRVPEEIRLAPRVLDESERRVIEQHPIHTVDMLETMRKVPNSVKYVCYQSHERYDGSGYPRSQWGDKLHIFSQIVAIADVYVAMTNDRPHRQAKKPYDAVRAILMDASANRYNKELVRAFLDAISLFPIGSMVQLNDGRQAKVLRSNPGKHTRPVVELLGPDGEELSGSVIDLVHENKLSVASPL